MTRPKESARLRDERIAGTDNGLTLRTRIVKDRTKYTRKIKHRKSIAEAVDFAFMPAVEKKLLFLCRLSKKIAIFEA